LKEAIILFLASCVKRHEVLVVVLAATPVSASQPLSDANVKLLSLKVNGKGEALRWRALQA